MMKITRREAVLACLGASTCTFLPGKKESLESIASDIRKMGFEFAQVHRAQGQEGEVVFYADIVHGLFNSTVVSLFRHLQKLDFNLALTEGYVGKYRGQSPDFFVFENEILKEGNPHIHGIDNDELLSLGSDFSSYNIARLNNLGNAPSEDEKNLENKILEKIKKYDGRIIGRQDLRDNYIKLDKIYTADERSIKSANEAKRIMQDSGNARAFMIYGANHSEGIIKELNYLGISVLWVMYRNHRLR